MLKATVDKLKSKKNPYDRSISRDLTIGIMLTVVVVSTIAISIIFYYASQSAMVNIDRKADELIVSMSKILDFPLWNFDEETVKNIGASYALNDLVAKLAIFDSMETVYFEMDKKNDGYLISRSSKVSHENKPVGRIDIALTSNYYQKINRQFILSSVFTIFINLIFLFIAVKILLKRFLLKPINYFSNVVSSYGTGNYDFQEMYTPVKEFQSSIIVLNEMGNEISYQMAELQKARNELEIRVESRTAELAKSNKNLKVEITERKQAEDALRKSRRTLLTLMSNLPGMAYRCLNDENRTMKFVSEGCFELTGFCPWEFIDNKNIAYGSLVHPDDQGYVRGEIQKALKNFSPFTIEYRITVSAGKERWVWEQGRGIFSQDNKFEAIEGFAIDITEKKKAEKELEKMHKIESVGTLAGGIAHDFNNLLMGLFGHISIAKRELSENHPGFKPLENAAASMNRATRLTRQLLTFAKGGGDPVKEDVNISKAIEETVHFDLSGSNVMPIFKQADDLWMAEVDKGQIQQVFSNLTINAKQAMLDGGHLYITLKNADIAKGVVPNLKQGKYIKVTVRDDGTGIDRKYLDQIFDPYFTTKQTGNGLGLPTIYSIINKHGGHISADSTIGKGTTFTLYLPASESRQMSETKQPEAEQPSTLGQKARILVMDDEEIIRDVLTEMLAKCGFTADSAIDGKAAMKKYISADKNGDPFDIVIMDLTIPGGMGGKKAVRELLAIDSKAKAIVSSGYSTDPVTANYSKYGFKGRLVKPFQMEVLKNELIRVMETG